MKIYFRRFRDRIGNLIKNQFVQDTATLQVGSVAGNFITAVGGILIARILQPELFGLYALVFSLAGFFNLILGFGSSDAAITVLSRAYARNDKDEASDIMAFLAKMTIITVSLALISVAFAPLLANKLYGNSLIGFYTIIVVVTAAISTTVAAFTIIGLQVVGRIRRMTILNFSGQVTKTGFAVLFAFLGFGVLGIVVGHLLSTLTIFFISVFIWRGLVRKHSILPSIRSLSRKIREINLKKYLGFNFLIAVDKNIANLFNILPILLTGIYVSTSEITFFKLAFAYINLALTFLGPVSVLLNVKLPKLHAVDDPKRLKRNFIKVSLYSAALSLVVTLGAVSVAPLAFGILYGDSFLPSVRYVYGLIIYGAFMGIGVGLGPMFRALNNVQTSIKINAVVLGLGIPAGIYLIKSYGLWGTVIWTTAIYTISHVTSYLVLVNKLKKI